MKNAEIKEEWRVIDEARDYKVSNFGRVSSNKYNATRVLKQNKKKTGYCEVGLCCKPNERKFFLVHRLVLSTFCPIDDMEYLEVNHKNEDKSDNHLSNLEWMTSKENCNYGTRNEKIGEPSRMKVMCIETGEIYRSQKQAAQLTKTCESSISNCLNGKRNVAGDCHWRRVE